jgi:hypothetical protein
VVDVVVVGVVVDVVVVDVVGAEVVLVGAVVVGAVVPAEADSMPSPGTNSGASSVVVTPTPGTGSVAPSTRPPSEPLHAAISAAASAIPAERNRRCGRSTGS